MHTRIISLFLSSLLLHACTGKPVVNSYAERKDRIGISRQQLVTELGKPVLEIHTTQEGGAPTTALIYRDHPMGLDCVDAYLIETASGTVIDYYCR